APRPGVAQLEGDSLFASGGTPTKTITFDQHPPPAQDFAVDECVETLGALFLLARTVAATLLSVAYSMTTCLEYHYGGWRGASNRLSIAKNVFDRINEFATARGIGAEIRKFDPPYPPYIVVESMTGRRPSSIRWIARRRSSLSGRTGSVGM